MKNSSQPKKKSHVGLAVISGITAAAAVGGYYLYHSKDAQKKLKNVKGWMVKAKGEVLEKIEKLKEVNEVAYHKVIDGVMSRYQKVSSIDGAELVKVTQELKSHWKSIQKDLTSGGKKVSSVVKQVIAGVKGGKTAPKKKAAAPKKTA